MFADLCCRAFKTRVTWNQSRKVIHKLNLAAVCFTGLAKWFLYIIFCRYILYFPIFKNHISSEFFFSWKIRKSATLVFRNNNNQLELNNAAPGWSMHFLFCHSLLHSLVTPCYCGEHHCSLPLYFHSCFANANSVYRQEESEMFFGPLSVSKSRETDDRPKRPFLEAKTSWILGHRALCHEISRKINDVLVQQLCQTTVIQFHNFNDTREVSFCPCFSYMLKSKKSSKIAAEKPVPECDTTCSEDFSMMWLDAACQQNRLIITWHQF